MQDICKHGLAVILAQKTATAHSPFWWESKFQDRLDETLRLFQTKSLNNWHFIYIVDTEWSSILIDSCLFAKGYDVENVLLKKEIYLLNYKEQRQLKVCQLFIWNNHLGPLIHGKTNVKHKKNHKA